MTPKQSYELGKKFMLIQYPRAMLQRVGGKVMTTPIEPASDEWLAHNEKFASDFECSYTGDEVLSLIARIRLLEAQTAPAEVVGWTLADLRNANVARQEEWCPDQKPDLSFRGNELAGEVGEACNVIKKLERERQGWAGSRSTKNDLAQELADIIITTDLTAMAAGIDLSAAVPVKFNATSKKVGMSTLLSTPTQAEAREAGIRELDEWHEDDGYAVWWTWQDGDWLGEPSYIGSPLCSDWPGYHTHWTPHPTFPPRLRALLTEGEAR